MKAITPKCYNKILEEIDDIQKNQLTAIAEEISIARSHGDLRENAQYSSAKEKQRMIESRLADLEEVISTYSIFKDEDKKFTKVTFGATVEIQFLDDDSIKTFQILSDYEADINKNIISINAPIAKGILDLEKDDEATIILKGKEREVLIRKII
ncbi:MAG: transcription elongation factor GreA [Candidatus Deianiraeaceae bacterium]|jgi:transcription elongation factor GreA